MGEMREKRTLGKRIQVIEAIKVLAQTKNWSDIKADEFASIMQIIHENDVEMPTEARIKLIMLRSSTWLKEAWRSSTSDELQKCLEKFVMSHYIYDVDNAAFKAEDPDFNSLVCDLLAAQTSSKDGELVDFQAGAFI